MRYLVIGLSLIISSTPAHANRVTAAIEGAKVIAKLNDIMIPVGLAAFPLSLVLIYFNPELRAH